MISLELGSLSQWYAKLPSDFQKAIKSDLPETENEELKTLVEKLSVTELGDLKSLLETSAEGLKALGRIGRIRLLAAISGKTYPYQVKIFKEIVEESGSEEGEGSHSESQLLFLEDIKAFNEAVAARVYTSSLDAVALSALNDAALVQEPPAPAPPGQ